MTDESSVRRGGKNIFADLGYPDAETHLLKAGLAKRIDEIIAANAFSPEQSAERMGISTHDVFRLSRGQFRDISVERLMRMLARLGCEVDIVVRAPGRPATEGDILRVSAAE